MVTKAQHLVRPSLFAEPLMLWVVLPVVGTIHPKSNKFVTGVKIKLDRGGSGLTMTALPM